MAENPGGSITTKFLVLFILLAVIPTGVLAYIGTTQLQNSFQDNVENTLTLALQSSVSGLIQYFRAILAETQLSSQDSFVVDELQKIISGGPADKLNTYLLKRKATSSAFNLTNESGVKAIVVSGKDGTILGSTHPGFIGKSIANEAFFKAALANASGSNSTTTFFESVVARPFIPAYKIKDAGNSTIGAYANIYSIKDLQDAMQGESTRKLLQSTRGDTTPFNNFTTFKDLSIYAVDSLGKMSISPFRADNKDLTGTPVETAPVKLCLMESKSFKGEYVNYEGVTVIGASLCSATKTSFVAEIPKDAALAPLASPRRILLLANGLVIILMLLALFGFQFYVLKPIKSLTGTINDISMGKLDVEVQGKERNDEIGDLAKAFDRTVVSLKLAMKEKGEKK